MKKLFTIILVTLLVATGCGQSAEEEKDQIQREAEEISNSHVGPTTEPFSAGPTELPE